MKTLFYIVSILIEILKVCLRRIVGIKKEPNWNLKTELIWASTRTALLSSNKFGLIWLKELSSKYRPKPKMGDQIHITTISSSSGNYKNVLPDKISNKIIVYFHGGGYVAGSPDTCIEFISRLAITARAQVLVPYYPTAPENTYPLTNEFAQNIIQHILKKHPNNDIYLAGDSAGAALVLSAAKNIDITSVKGFVLISPWIEPKSANGSVHINAELDVGDQEFLKNCYDAYVNGAELLEEHPLTFNKTNLKKLPPTLTTVGTNEMLLDQVFRLSENLKGLKTETSLLYYKSMFHTFWNMAPNIKEANKLIDDVSNWIHEKT